MSTHPVTWQSPQPLWARFGATSAVAATAADQSRPAILRFASDDFMEQMLATLARDPARIDRLVARPETWRAPMTEVTDLMERTPIPALAQAGARLTFGRQAKSAVAVTVAEADVNVHAETRRLPLKLFQPAHQRYYLVSASLVCALPGFPERGVVAGGAEQVNFVLRRLLPTVTDGDELREFAFVKDANGARWQRVGENDSAPVAGEDLLPVFPLAYQDDAHIARRLWAGMVPVGRREEYVTSQVNRTAAPSFAFGQQQSLGIAVPETRVSKRARVTQFQMEVAEPWKNLIRTSVKASSVEKEPSPIDGETEPDVDAKGRQRVYEFNLQQQHTSWLILLDFADFIDVHMHDLWETIVNNGAGFPSLSDQCKALYTWLGTADMPALLLNGLKPTDASLQIPPALGSMRAALQAIRAPGVREKLERIELTYTKDVASLTHPDWPPFRFVLAGLDTNRDPSGPFQKLTNLATATAAEVDPDPPASPVLAAVANKVDNLTALVGRGLVEIVETGAPPLPFALQVSDALRATAGDPGWFVVRFVYQNRDCGPLHPPLLSAPTQRFQLASFFDSDAPARPIRIALPLDTSPAGLRKFNKNTAFVLSDMLCGQVQRAKGLGFIDLVRSVLPWPLHKDLDVGPGGPCKDGSLSLGMICSISIPIITICALILLFIFVLLLDLVFHWIPYFVICFPVPKFKGKS